MNHVREQEYGDAEMDIEELAESDTGRIRILERSNEHSPFTIRLSSKWITAILLKRVIQRWRRYSYDFALEE